MADATPGENSAPRQRREFLTFLFLCVVLFPALSIALIGSYGLAVWISHALGG